MGRGGERGPARAAERGSATLELVVVFPAVLLLIFGIVQGGVWYHARTIATYAAAEGLRAAQARDGSAAAGQARATSTLAHAGARGFLHDVVAAAERDAGAARVTVNGHAVGLLPGLHLPVRRSVSGPVERLLEEVP